MVTLKMPSDESNNAEYSSKIEHCNYIKCSNFAYLFTCKIYLQILHIYLLAKMSMFVSMSGLIQSKQ